MVIPLLLAKHLISFVIPLVTVLSVFALGWVIAPDIASIGILEDMARSLIGL